jgi:predicted nucleotidyltransferase
MNTIRDDFPKNVKDFFRRLENYLDTDLYFYGSVNRDDYIHNKSDIDIAIFTDNEYSIITKLQHFLHVKRQAFDKVVWKLEGNMIYGYKIKCEKYIDIKCEIAIYNNDFKPILLKEITRYNIIPHHIAFLLFIIKTMYYIFPIISQKTYSSYKRYIFNDLMLQRRDTIFLILKQT